MQSDADREQEVETLQNGIDRNAANARRHGFQSARAFMVLFACFVAAAAIAYHRLDDQARTQRAQTTQLRHQEAALKHQAQQQRAAIYGGCHRQNLGRVTGNRNNYAQYKLWQATITLLKFTPQVEPTTKQAREGAALFTAFLTAMDLTLRSESWTPLADCAAATDHPGTYTPPASVPFTQQLPPLSAFTLGPGE